MYLYNINKTYDGWDLISKNILFQQTVQQDLKSGWVYISRSSGRGS